MNPVITQITPILDRGECVQVIGLPGMGTSRLGIALGGFLINSGLYPNFSADQYIALVSSHPTENLLVIDSIDRLLKPELTEFFIYLKALRDQQKYQLKYVFLNHTASPVSTLHKPFLANLFSLLSENIVYLQPILPVNIPERIKNDFSPDIGFIPDSKQLKIIISLSGGIPALIKIVMQSLRDQKSLDPAQNPALKAQLEDIYQALGSHPHPELLQIHGLTDPSGQINSLLLRNFLASKTPLSSSETKLLNLFKANLGQTISKDQICDIIYPDVKNRSGISDHAIDQLIHRLREKIKNDYKLTTRRGLGYQLTPG
jgi:hypothetical protein